MMNLEIFWVFFRISLLSFGGVFGVLPELERNVVVEQGWLTHDRFIQSYVVSQFVPGPNMAMCPLIGYWVNGWGGFVAGFFGIYTGPFLVMGLALYFFMKFRNIDWVLRLERALRPLVFGLTFASGLRLWWYQAGGGGVGSHSATELWALRILCLVLSLVSFELFRRKYVQPMSLIFAMGGAWWILSWALTQWFVNS
jgi:chromate transporter